MKRHQSLVNMSQPVVEGLGYTFWGLEFLNRGSDALLRIYIDKDEGVDVDDCQKVSQQLVGILDVEDPIPGSYQLEVSSPGMDRILFTAEQCQFYRGEKVRVRLVRKYKDRRRFSGTICSATEAELELLEDGEHIAIPMASIETIRLVPEFQN